MSARSEPITRTAYMMLCCALLVALVPSDAFGQRFQRKAPPPMGRWYLVDRAEGVVVKALEREEYDLPLLRVTAVLPAGLYKVAAVLWDANEFDRWMAHIEESRLLERGGLDFLYYQRIDTPWPMADRDSVLSVRVDLDPSRGRLTSRFRNVRDRRNKAVDGVVQMSRLSGKYDLRAVSTNRTRVTLLMDMDPGGSIPKWLVRTATQQLPLEMILTLRRRVARVGDRYERLIAGWRAGHGMIQVARD